MKKTLGFIVALALALTTIAGCSSKSGDTSNTGNTGNTETTTTSPAPEKKDKAIVTVIQNKVEIQEQLEAAAKDFNSTQSDVEVQILGSAGDNLVTTLQSQFASSPETAPVIFTCGSGSEFEKFFNYMAPLDSLKSASVIAKGQADDAMKDGKLYGLPVALEGFGLIYNKSLFEKAGVKAEDIKTMEDLAAAAEKLSKLDGVEAPIAFAKETYFQFMHPINWPFATMSNYKEVIPKVISGELKLKDIPEVKKYVEELEMLKKYTNRAKSTYDEQVAGFATGAFAMIHQGNWAQGIIDEYEVDFEYGMLPMPTNGNNGIAVGNANFFRINKHVTKEQQDGAAKFLDWLFTEKAGQTHYTEEFKLIPPYEGFDVSNLNPLAQEVSRYATAGKTVGWTFNLFPAGVDKDCASAMEKFYADQINTDQLLDEINQVWVNAAKQ